MRDSFSLRLTCTRPVSSTFFSKHAITILSLKDCCDSCSALYSLDATVIQGVLWNNFDTRKQMNPCYLVSMLPFLIVLNMGIGQGELRC